MSRQRLYLDINVVDAARERLRHVFDTFDEVHLQFSGGKDSTACLYLMKEIHEERGLGPVKVIFRDEEMVSPKVIEFVEEVRNYDWVDMEWFCVAPETEVITKSGTYPISTLAGQEHWLMTERGKWVKAPIRSFGVRPVQTVVLRRNGVEKRIRATPDHRWFTVERFKNERGEQEVRSEKTTAELLPGDRLKGVWSTRHVVNPSPFGVAHGFTFGDGNVARNGCQVTFHGEKDQALLPFFGSHVNSEHSTKSGVMSRATGMPLFFKDFPSLDESDQYLYGWLVGYFAADGCVSKEGRVSLSSSKKANLDFVKTVCTRLGIFSYETVKGSPGSFATDDSEMWQLTLAREDLNEKFFIIHKHAERWLANPRQRTKSRSRQWIVEKVEDNMEEVETYCAVVEGTHSFALSGNILTGNCLPQGQEIWVLGRREYVLLWSPARKEDGRLVREIPEWAITAEHFGLNPAEPIPKSVDYYTLAGKNGLIAYVTGVRANESMIRYRSLVQKLHENYIVHPYRMPKNVPLRFAKVIYDWESSDVFKFVTEEHGGKFCEFYDLAALTGSNPRVGIPLHSVAIRRIGDVVLTEPEFYDRLWECFPQIDAQRRYWSSFDIEGLIQSYSELGWEGVKQCIEENMMTPGIKTTAMAFAHSFRRKHEGDPQSYPVHWLIRTLLLNEFHGTSPTPIGPGTKADAIRKAMMEAEANSLDLQDDLR